MVELGSSDAPVIMGVSPHRTRWNLGATLVGLLPESDYESEIMSMGTALQDTVLREFCLRGRWVIEKEQHTHNHRTRPWQRATPDGELMRYDRGEDRATLALAEVKCVVGHVPDVPRVDWLIQCLHQRMVLESIEPDYVHGEQHLIAFGGLRLVSWEIPRHQAAMDRVLREEEKFLAMLERGELPPVSARDASALNRAWPWVEPHRIALPDDLIADDGIIDAADMHIEDWTKRRDESEARIKAALGEASEGVLSTGVSYSWKYHARGGFVVKPNRVRPFKRHGRKSDEG